MRHRHNRRWVGFVCALALICGCGGGRPSTIPEPEPPDQCAVAFQTGVAADTVSIAVTHELTAHNAPLAANDSERLVFRQLYETLVGVDCAGRVKPGLADSWTEREDGRVWTFSIRPEARFWDGTQVTARDVRSSWLSHRTSAMGISIRTVMAVSDHLVMVTFDTSQEPFPTMLAHPAFAVVKDHPASAWPVGTGDYRAPEDIVGPDDGRAAAIVVRPGAPRDGRTPPVLRFVPVGQRDVRDVLDRDLDVVVTPDPRVIEYANGDERFRTIELPWDRTYLLVSNAFGNDPALVRELIDEREDLASRAVSAEARSATDWFGVTARERCAIVSAESSTQPQASRELSDRVAYLEHDAVARSLAERLVAKRELVSRQRDERRLTAAPLSSEQFAAALAMGNEFAYVVAVPRRPLAVCRDLQSFVTGVPWLGAGNGLTTMTVPLIDTRPRLIVRDGIADITTEWDGVLVFSDEVNRGSPADARRE